MPLRGRLHQDALVVARDEALAGQRAGVAALPGDHLDEGGGPRCAGWIRAGAAGDLPEDWRGQADAVAAAVGAHLSEGDAPSVAHKDRCVAPPGDRVHVEILERDVGRLGASGFAGVGGTQLVVGAEGVLRTEDSVEGEATEVLSFPDGSSCSSTGRFTIPLGAGTTWW